MEPFLVIGGAFALFGLLFGTIGAAFLGREHRFRERAHEADAVVEGFRHSDGCDFPILSYYANGRLTQAFSRVGSSRSPYMVGDRVTVLYLPEHPERFVICGDRSTKLIGGVFTGFGVVFLVLGLIFMGMILF